MQWPLGCSTFFTENNGFPDIYFLYDFRNCTYISDSQAFPFYASQFLCTYCVFSRISFFFSYYNFFPHSIEADYYLLFIFIFINSGSACFKFTIPTSTQSPCGVPITVTYLSPILLYPNPLKPSSFRHYRYL